jgi:hypothetical protein
MKKEEWVNHILESASEINEVEANPFLFQKILTRISSPEKGAILTSKYRLAWTVAISVVIAVNISAFALYKSRIHKQKEEAVIEVLSNEMDTNTTYNY